MTTENKWRKEGSHMCDLIDMAEMEKALERHHGIASSPYIDRNLLKDFWNDHCDIYWQGCWQESAAESTLERTEKYLLGLLRRQFGILELDDMYKELGERKCAEFLNDALAFYQNRKDQEREFIDVLLDFHRGGGELLPEIVDEFIAFTDEEIVCPSSDMLSIRKYLKMCRVAYDAVGVSGDYPPNASDLFVYCGERMLSFQDDFRCFHDSDWDSPEIFSDFASSRYHPEEIQYGGMIILIRNVPGGWIGGFRACRHQSICDPKRAKQAIVAYVALRRCGYPIVCSDPQTILKEARVVR